MSIRKHKGKIALSIAAAFWAACDNDSGNEPTFEIIKGNSCEEDEQAAGCQAIALYGVPSYDMSSAEVSGDCDEASGCAESSSSEASATESSSSEALAPASSSVNSEYPYPLYSDPNVHCKDTTTYQYTNNCPKSTSPKYYDCNSYKELLSTNKYLSEEELVKMEKEALECNMPAPVYGVSYPVCNESYYSSVSYTCDDGKPFNRKYLLHEGVVYTQEEYNALFVSSSSVEPSSSEVSSSSVESSSSKAGPICQIDDFIDMNGASDSIRTAVVDGVIASKGDQISDEQKSCVKSIPLNYIGVIGKKKICDGVEAENDFFTEQIEELKKTYSANAEECFDETAPTSSKSVDPASSSAVNPASASSEAEVPDTSSSVEPPAAN